MNKTSPAFNLLIATLIAVAAPLELPALADDKKPKYEKPIEGPELEGAIKRSRANEVEAGEPTPDTTADLAFGAFQRGYYLTALRLALPRAETGDPAAQTLIAEIYWNGLGVAQDRKEAIKWYAFAADAGNREAQFSYGNALLQGNNVEADKVRGEGYLRSAANAGHAQAQFNLAQIITARRPTWASFKKALPFYTKAAESGIPDAQYALANIYAEAKGVQFNDDETARKWLAKAAAGGLNAAQVEYAIWLANGRGGTKSLKDARDWFIRAAAKGNVIARNRLARMYSFGVGVERDIILGGAWHILSKRAGFSDSELDQLFATLSDINKKRVLEAANQLGNRTGS